MDPGTSTPSPSLGSKSINGGSNSTQSAYMNRPCGRSKAYLQTARHLRRGRWRRRRRRKAQRNGLRRAAHRKDLPSRGGFEKRCFAIPSSSIGILVSSSSVLTFSISLESAATGSFLSDHGRTGIESAGRFGWS